MASGSCWNTLATLQTIPKLQSQPQQTIKEAIMKDIKLLPSLPDKTKFELALERLEEEKEYKSNNPCVDCGETNPLVLDFDHVRGEKKRNISDMAHACCSINTIIEEMEKCDIRCSNCHRIATYNNNRF